MKAKLPAEPRRKRDGYRYGHAGRMERLETTLGTAIQLAGLDSAAKGTAYRTIQQIATRVVDLEASLIAEGIGQTRFELAADCASAARDLALLFDRVYDRLILEGLDTGALGA